MGNNPLFSVLVANYNNGDYLLDAIESVRKQTYTNWEIILVDDGSTDNSLELYKILGEDPRIHIYFNGKNSGCGFTKNRCAAEAHGEICGFLDPDDTLLPEALEKHVKAHLENENASVVYSKAHYCDTNFNVIDEAELPDLSGGRTYFDYRWWGCMHFTSYKKSFYDKTVGINPKAYAGVDQDLYFVIEEAGDIVALDEFCYNYVIKGHDHSIATDQKNYFRLWYWNLDARRRAAVRRGLDVDAIMYEDTKRVFDKYVDIQVHQAVYDKELEVRASLAYRIGNAIVAPVKKIAGLFRKK